MSGVVRLVPDREDSGDRHILRISTSPFLLISQLYLQPDPEIMFSSSSNTPNILLNDLSFYSIPIPIPLNHYQTILFHFYSIPFYLYSFWHLSHSLTHTFYVVFFFYLRFILRRFIIDFSFIFFQTISFKKYFHFCTKI